MANTLCSHSTHPCTRETNGADLSEANGTDRWTTSGIPSDNSQPDDTGFSIGPDKEKPPGASATAIGIEAVPGEPGPEDTAIAPDHRHITGEVTDQTRAAGSRKSKPNRGFQRWQRDKRTDGCRFAAKHANTSSALFRPSNIATFRSASSSRRPFDRTKLNWNSGPWNFGATMEFKNVLRWRKKMWMKQTGVRSRRDSTKSTNTSLRNSADTGTDAANKTGR